GSSGAVVKGTRAKSGQSGLANAAAMPTVVAPNHQLTSAADRFTECLPLIVRNSLAYNLLSVIAIR
ncbi:MAG TPA: hypothetical protein VMG10_36160, partial [Gemmataceae bacterium]|nr:hypothetical protein [Gemmataceae bacterium]